MQLNLFNLSLIFYFLSGVFYLGYAIFKRKKIAYLASTIFILGFILNSLLIIQRWLQASRPPLANMYESLVFFVWATALVYIIFELRFKIRFVGIPVALLLTLGLGGASFLDKAIQPLIPALRSNWLTIHVMSYFIGYGMTTISFILSAIYLFTYRKLPAHLLALLDVLSYRLVAFGFPFLSLGLITGAVWANVAWGSYWSWDPKETWSLITWLTYLFYLHARILRGWQGRKTAYLNILGFLSVLFTFLGVNFILPGLHSYS